MLLIGLTGSIGSGKSFVATCFKRLSAPVYDSDKAVHKLLEENQELILEISKLWPDAVIDNQVIRPKLGEHVFGNPTQRIMLENLIYPRLNDAKRQFLQMHSKLDTPVVIMDIPLLYEAGYKPLFDKTICVVVDNESRKNRVLRRPNMTEEKFFERDSVQMPQADKIKLADYIIHSGLHKGDVMEAVKHLLSILVKLHPKAWQTKWIK